MYSLPKLYSEAIEIADDEASPKTGNVSSPDWRSKEITTAKRRLKIDIGILYLMEYLRYMTRVYIITLIF